MKVLIISFLIFTIPLFTNDYSNAYFAGGCFWGVEYYMEQLDGVIDVKSGFMGGFVENPSYNDVIWGKTGHYETVEVIYNPKKIDFETLTKFFFEIHDPTQTNGQGPDIGEQYLSVVFYNNDQEKIITEKLISILENKGYKVATMLKKVSIFYIAEDYHQDYYKNNGKLPYCHNYTKRF